MECARVALKLGFILTREIGKIMEVYICSQRVVMKM